MAGAGMWLHRGDDVEVYRPQYDAWCTGKVRSLEIVVHYSSTGGILTSKTLPAGHQHLRHADKDCNVFAQGDSVQIYSVSASTWLNGTAMSIEAMVRYTKPDGVESTLQIPLHHEHVRRAKLVDGQSRDVPVRRRKPLALPLPTKPPMPAASFGGIAPEAPLVSDDGLFGWAAWFTCCVSRWKWHWDDEVTPQIVSEMSTEGDTIDHRFSRVEAVDIMGSSGANTKDAESPNSSRILNRLVSSLRFSGESQQGSEKAAKEAEKEFTIAARRFWKVKDQQ